MSTLKTLSLSFALLSSLAYSADNLIDHKLPKNTGGIYRAQDAVPILLGVATFGGALWEGSESRLGKTLWQSSEAYALSGITAKGLKYVIRRERPSETDDANQWFQGNHNGSFPSTHVAVTAAGVTPLIMEYKDDHPWVIALAVLPAYEMVARVKAQEHWQTDVLASAVIGVAIGAYEHSRTTPWSVNLLPKGAVVGFHQKF